MVRRSPSCTASTDVTRPLMEAEPMLRAPRPEIVSESTLTLPLSVVAGGGGAATRMGLAGALGRLKAGATLLPVGFSKRELSIGTLTSIESYVTLARTLESLSGPDSTAN